MGLGGRDNVKGHILGLSTVVNILGQIETSNPNQVCSSKYLYRERSSALFY